MPEDFLDNYLKRVDKERSEKEARPTATAATYPIVGALVKAEDMPGMGTNRTWHPVNPQQESLINNVFPLARDEVGSIPEIESVASHSASEINAFLKERGFDIKLDEIEPGNLGAASVLDLLVEWEQKGQAIKLKTPKGDYDGVSIDKKGVRIRNSRAHRSPVAELATKSGDQVFMTIVDNPPLQDGDLVDLAQRIQKGLDWEPVKYDGLMFPMVDLNQKVDIGWLQGLSTTGEDGRPAVISKAIQQNILKMNETGAQAKSAVAVMALRGFDYPKPPMVIDRPFMVWFARKGLSQPLFVGYIKEDAWKNPGEILATSLETK